MTTGNPWSAIASGVGSGATFVLKICEYTYALRAVDQQTEEYLIVAQHADKNIKNCQRLLSERKDLLPAEERKDYERVIRETERAAEAVALLLEPARVDAEADSKIHFSTRLSWVLTDNANITAALTRLGIVHATLTQNINTLRLIRPSEMSTLEPVRSNERPPSYSSSQLLHWKHQTRLTPKPSMASVRENLVSQRVAATFVQDDLQMSPGEYQYQSNVGRSTTTNVPVQIIVPVEMSAGPVPPSRPLTELYASENGMPSIEIGQNGSVRGSMSWLERQAMKSSILRQNQRLAQNV